MPHDVSRSPRSRRPSGWRSCSASWSTKLKLPALVGYLLAGIVIGPATPGFVADVEHRKPARRDRRDAADVRRRACISRWTTCSRCAASRCPARSCRWPSPRRSASAWRMCWGWSFGRRAGLRSIALGRQHRRAAEGARKPGRAANRSTGASPWAGSSSRTSRWSSCSCCCRRWPAGSAADAAVHDRQRCRQRRSRTLGAGRRVRGADAGRGPAGVSLAAVAGGADRLARALHARA